MWCVKDPALESQGNRIYELFIQKQQRVGIIPSCAASFYIGLQQIRYGGLHLPGQGFQGGSVQCADGDAF